ncbi:hypothetical protein KL946_003293 [Ogataea haglerorum]|uniref:Respiratory growth induced protein 1 n=1 Tax=Ogataea haglerorum TaxID=1937702 RepID=A0ABQ7RFD7_9ASCO|nr:hypothetical protein KL946_003293 [Ogataea haglerorum]
MAPHRESDHNSQYKIQGLRAPAAATTMTKKYSSYSQTEPTHLEHLSPATSRKNSVDEPPLRKFDDIVAFEQYLKDETWDNEFDYFHLKVNYLPPFVLHSIHDNPEKIKPTMNSRSRKFVRHLGHHIKRHLLSEINYYTGVNYNFEKAVVEHRPDGTILFHLHDYSDHGYGEETDKYNRHWKVDLDVKCNPENPYVEVDMKSCAVVLGHLVEVHAHFLGLLDALELAAGDLVHQEAEHVGGDEAPHGDADPAGKLVAHLLPVVVDPSAGNLGHAVQTSHVWRGKHSEADRPENAANAVHNKRACGVVNAEPLVDVVQQPAARSNKRGCDKRPVRRVEAAARRDVDEPDHGTLARGRQTPLALEHEVNKREHETGHGRGDLRVGHDVAGPCVDREQRARVEAEPRAPDDGHADEGGHDVLRLVVLVGGRVFPVLALADEVRERERRNARGYVDRAAAGEVQRAELVQPAVGGPRGVRERAVADRAPQEPDHERGHDPGALGDGPDEDLHGGHREENREGEVDDRRDRAALDERPGAQLRERTKSKVATHVRRRNRDRERVAKQKPLDCDGAGHHVRLEQHLDDIFLLEHAAVEQADAWRENHDSDGAEHHVAHVCGHVRGGVFGEGVERVALGCHEQLSRAEPRVCVSSHSGRTGSARRRIYCEGPYESVLDGLHYLIKN